MGHDVFLSYSSDDKTTSDGVCALLEAENIRCWVAPRDIAPGADWGESIIDGINGASVFVLIFSANANSSPQVKREVERAVHKGIPIIPFRIDDVVPAKSLEYFLSTSHWLDAFTPPMEKHARYLAQTIRRFLDGDATPERVEPARSIPLPPRSSVKPKNWQIAAATILFVLVAYYFLAPSGPENLAEEAAPNVVEAPAEERAIDLAETPAEEPVIVVAEPPAEEPAPSVADAPPELPAPDVFENLTAAPAPSLVGKWEAVEITPNLANMSQTVSGSAIGEIVLAALEGPNKSAEFEVDDTGQYTYRLTMIDRGVVTNDGGNNLIFTSGSDGRVSRVSLLPLAEERVANLSVNGALPDERGVALSAPGRTRVVWFGMPNNVRQRGLLARFAGQWHNQATVIGQPGAVDSELNIARGGSYVLRVVQSESGPHEAGDGQWTRTPASGVPKQGSYVFDGNDMMTTTSDSGSLTWRRVE